MGEFVIQSQYPLNICKSKREIAFAKHKVHAIFENPSTRPMDYLKFQAQDRRRKRNIHGIFEKANHEVNARCENPSTRSPSPNTAPWNICKSNHKIHGRFEHPSARSPSPNTTSTEVLKIQSHYPWTISKSKHKSTFAKHNLAFARLYSIARRRPCSTTFSMLLEPSKQLPLVTAIECTR